MSKIAVELKKEDLYIKNGKINKNILYPYEKITRRSNEVSPLPCMHEKNYFEIIAHRF